MDKDKKELLNKAISDKKHIFISGNMFSGKSDLVMSIENKHYFNNSFDVFNSFNISFRKDNIELANVIILELLNFSSTQLSNFGICMRDPENVMYFANLLSKIFSLKTESIFIIDNFDRFCFDIPTQKKVMPILTKYFPHIQFVVVTNSPFIINSIPAFCYNCSNGFWYDDVTMYSCEALVECFLDTDKYSLLVVEKYKRLKELHKKYLEDTASEEEDEERIELERYFEQTPIQLDNNLGLNLCVFELDKVFKNREKNEV